MPSAAKAELASSSSQAKSLLAVDNSSYMESDIFQTCTFFLKLKSMIEENSEVGEFVIRTKDYRAGKSGLAEARARTLLSTFGSC